MEVGLSPRTRKALYVITAVGTPVVAYLNAIHVIGSLEVTLWSAEVAVIAGLAAFKVNK